MHTNVQKWVTPLSGYLKFYIYGYMDGASSTASIEEAYPSNKSVRKRGLILKKTPILQKFLFCFDLVAPVGFAPDLMAIVVIGSCPGLLLCVGVWVCAMAVMTTFFSRV
uniref:Uncharacterized protein n=1 Tax=Gossypium raimondii TaxID=29730 RepID=A0A0D2UVH1_GOSRA|nr:hypothetical protein B456_011G183000 [Gossypium raimondii]